MTVDRDREYEIARAWSEGRLSATEASVMLGYEDRILHVLIALEQEYGLPYPDSLPDLPDSDERVRRAAEMFPEARGRPEEIAQPGPAIRKPADRVDVAARLAALREATADRTVGNVSDLLSQLRRTRMQQLGHDPEDDGTEPGLDQASPTPSPRDR